MMQCGLCEELNKRKLAGNPKRTISSIANWWWVNNHDDFCTYGSHLKDWVTSMDLVTMENDEITPQLKEIKNPK